MFIFYKPVWDYWNKMHEATLVDCVALACNIDPRWLPDRWGLQVSHPLFVHLNLAEMKEFTKRFPIACGAVSKREL